MFVKFVKNPEYGCSQEERCDVMIVDCETIYIQNISGEPKSFIYLNKGKESERCFEIEFNKNGRSNLNVYLMNNEGQTIDKIY